MDSSNGFDQNVLVFRIPDLIMKKRNGESLSADEITYFINSLTNGNALEQSQIGAMLMAIYFRGMNFQESFHLTKAMMNSGAKLDFSDLVDPVVDKHSTGGVGEKVSFPLAAALAACGLKVPMISGRGLGWTGGTLDKLEAIPGCNVSLSKEKIEHTVKTVGCCIVGQTIELNPADRILYATRDITSTVDCIPLIAGSIVSKKAIEDLQALVLDVKIGKGAFIKDLANAEQLAKYMAQIAGMLKIKAGVFITDHDSPYGRTIGNQIEIEEAIECLNGNMTEDIQELVLKFGGYLLYRTNRCNSLEEGENMILKKLKNGEALKVFKQMIIAQGVNEDIATELCDNKNYSKVFKQSLYNSFIYSNESGYISSIDALELGMTIAKLGAGRQKASDKISYEVGMRLLKTVGDEIKAGEPWIEIHHNNDSFEILYEESLKNAIKISHQPVKRESLILKLVESE